MNRAAKVTKAAAKVTKAAAKVTKAALKVMNRTSKVTILEEREVVKFLEETILIVSAAWMLIYFFYPAGSQLLQLAFWAIPFVLIYAAILMIAVKRKRG